MNAFDRFRPEPGSAKPSQLPGALRLGQESQAVPRQAPTLQQASFVRGGGAEVAGGDARFHAGAQPVRLMGRPEPGAPQQAPAPVSEVQVAIHALGADGKRYVARFVGDFPVPVRVERIVEE